MHLTTHSRLSYVTNAPINISTQAKMPCGESPPLACGAGPDGRLSEKKYRMTSPEHSSSGFDSSGLGFVSSALDSVVQRNPVVFSASNFSTCLRVCSMTLAKLVLLCALLAVSVQFQTFRSHPFG